MQRRTGSSNNLTSLARNALGTNLGALLDARRDLRADLLEDPLELTTFGVSASNVGEVLETRLRLLEQVRDKISASTASAAVNEQPLATLGLSSVDLWKGYIPLACLLLEKWQAHKASSGEEGGAFVLGINAGPGSGKSTLVQVLLFLLSASSDRPLKVAQISSDDLYLGLEARQARHISSRLDPASLDPTLFDLVARLKHSTADSPPIELPRFNKGKDDREATGTVVSGAFDLVLYEGWRVGVQPGQLNGSAFDYTALNDPIDFLLYIDADPTHVFEWKLESTMRDHCREHPNTPWTDAHVEKLKAAWDLWIEPFILQHEKPLAQQGGSADAVFAKDASHNITKIDLKSTLKSFYDAHLASAPTQARAASALVGAFGRASLAPLLLKQASARFPSSSPSPSPPPKSLASSSPSPSEEDSWPEAGVSFDAFVDTARQLIEASGELPQIGWHRFVTSSATAHLSGKEDSRFKLNAGCLVSGSFKCASVAIQGDCADALSNLVDSLAGATPTFVMVYTTDPDTIRRVNAACQADPRFQAAVVQACTTCLGSLTSSSNTGVPSSLFGIHDPSGVYTGAGAGIAATEEDGSAPGAGAWKTAAQAVAAEALEAGVAAGASGVPLVLLHATPGHEEAVLEGIEAAVPGAQVFGGSAADNDGSFIADHWAVSSGKTVLQGRGVSVSLLWPTVPYAISLNCLHEAASDRHSARVSEVGDDGRQLISFDGRPAGQLYDEWTADDQADESEDQFATRTTLKPLARGVRDQAAGVQRFFPVHPHKSRSSDQSLGLFAAVSVGDTLTTLSGTRESIVDAVNVAVHRTRGRLTGSVSGALAIYCAGCGLELARSESSSGSSLTSISNEIRTALPGSTPFAAALTYGEQGPLLNEGNTHANLMFNLLLFGIQ
ncbi:unnamed protein product [Polarella glacialis]|uniref:Uncharacterized protein n=1 Tax=Polarella glacialis TaxID=89957 RepID=A0A813G8X8_POLGL|nr:unnamed protein product [Polarella glacialis]